jgi:hypothetical protein
MASKRVLRADKTLVVEADDETFSNNTSGGDNKLALNPATISPPLQFIVACISIYFIQTLMFNHRQSLLSQPKGGTQTTVGQDLVASVNEQSAQSEPQFPSVALLMSFPNSGTTFTLLNTRSVSNVTTAVNYCEIEDSHRAPDIWEDRVGPHFMPDHQNFTMPTKYVMTKTHCGGRCTDCKPNQDYMISQHQFEKECLRICLKSEPKKTFDHYAMSTVGKAIHLFRDPLDNLISRFHLHIKNEVRKQTRFAEKHPKSPEGYSRYCAELDSNSKLSKADKKAYSPELWNLAKKVPCHADLYRYTEWHNHAFEMTNGHNISTLLLHYKDYHLDFNGTVKSVLGFLEMKWTVDPDEFYWSDYSAYYTDEQREDAQAFVRALATPETWEQVKRYF